MSASNGHVPPHQDDVFDEIAAILEREDIAADVIGSVRLSALDSLLITEILAVLEDHVGHRIVEEAFPPEETTLADLVAFAEQYGAPAP